MAIELLSFSLYVAVSLAKRDRRSGEAGLKYVLLGSTVERLLKEIPCSALVVRPTAEL